MNIIKTDIPDVLIIEPRVFGDARGFFYESFNQKVWQEKTAYRQLLFRTTIPVPNEMFCAVCTIRFSSPRESLCGLFGVPYLMWLWIFAKSRLTFGRWVGVELSEDNHRQMWIPEGFAHGFLVLSDFAEFLYKTTDYWAPQYERTIIWNDPDLAIAWPLQNQPILSAKDAQGTPFKEAEKFE